MEIEPIKERAEIVFEDRGNKYFVDVHAEIEDFNVNADCRFSDGAFIFIEGELGSGKFEWTSFDDHPYSRYAPIIGQLLEEKLNLLPRSERP